MIGQRNLLQALSKYSFDTFPRSVLLVAPQGAGKHTLANYIKDNIIKLPLFDITDTLSDELIVNIYTSPNPAIYLIDLTGSTEKFQNIVLKFVEEPLNNAFIILLAENENLLLNTVLNRCAKFTFEPYSKEELKSFLPEGCDEGFLQYVNTPGKLKSCNVTVLQNTIDYAEKIATKIGQATYPNALSIASKVNFKDEYNKLDFEVLVDALLNSLFKRYLTYGDINAYAMYEIAVERKKTLVDTRLNKESWLESLITALWQYSKEVHNG